MRKGQWHYSNINQKIAMIAVVDQSIAVRSLTFWERLWFVLTHPHARARFMEKQDG